MPNLDFNNPQTKEKFECNVEKDRMVHKPQVYSGLLSNITPEMADAMVKDGSNVIKEKAAAAAGASNSKDKIQIVK